MRLKNADLIVIVVIAALNIVWVLLSAHSTIIGIILALPLVFVLPGYAVTEALAYNRSLSVTYRALLSLGLSLAIDILSGFVLNMFSVGLRALSWVVLLGLLIVVFSLLVAYLRRKSSADERRLLAFRFRIYDYLLAGLALLMVVLSLQYSATSVEQPPHAGFTQLWMLPPQTTKNCTVRLGVRSFESTSTTYHIMMKENGIQVGIWSPIVLTPQEEWDHVVTIPTLSASSVSVEVSLYKADRPEKVYREVHLVLKNVEEERGKNTICGASDISSRNN